MLSPMAELNNGKRRIVSIGNAGHDKFKTIKGLSYGKYLWSVQSIDNCFEGSNFAETKSFTTLIKNNLDFAFIPEKEVKYLQQEVIRLSLYFGRYQRLFESGLFNGCWSNMGHNSYSSN